jgi:Transposase
LRLAGKVSTDLLDLLSPQGEGLTAPTCIGAKLCRGHLFWRASLKWQRLKPFEKFAEMIDQHWEGIAAYCRPENKIALGFVEGLNNKIRVIQRRAYGLRDEEYLRLKVLTCMLPSI